MTSPEVKARNIRSAFNFTIIYTIISLTWLIFGQTVKKNIENRVDIGQVTLTHMYIINVLLSSG